MIPICNPALGNDSVLDTIELKLILRMYEQQYVNLKAICQVGLMVSHLYCLSG